MQAIYNTKPAAVSFYIPTGGRGVQHCVNLNPGVTFVPDDHWLAIAEHPQLVAAMAQGAITDSGASFTSAEDALLEAGAQAPRLVAQCFDKQLASAWLTRERSAKKPRFELVSALEARIAELN